MLKNSGRPKALITWKQIQEGKLIYLCQMKKKKKKKKREEKRALNLNLKIRSQTQKSSYIINYHKGISQNPMIQLKKSQEFKHKYGTMTLINQ